MRNVVTAAEFTRHFGQLRSEPDQAPVFVTHHGRETHVLLTRRRYDELAEAPAAPERPFETALCDLAEWLPHAVLVLDRGGVVRFANPPAHAMLRLPAGKLIGRQLNETVPALAGSLMESYFKRTVRSGEAHAADLPSLLEPGAWVHAEMRPAGELITILLRDITEDMQRYRLANRSDAVAAAVRLHRGIGQIELNVRGYIEAVDDASCALLALPAARLVNVPVVDLIPSSGRVAFREQLDAVLRGAGPITLEVVLISNTGDALTMVGTLVELRGMYGSEGAVLVIAQRR